jgi:hypothetical protein
MLSQTTAGTQAVLFVCPDDLPEQVNELSSTELAVALAMSGVPLSRSMSLDEVSSAAAAGLLSFGRRNVRVRGEYVLALNLAMLSGEITPGRHAVSYRELFGSNRRFAVANGLAWRYIDRARKPISVRLRLSAAVAA